MTTLAAARRIMQRCALLASCSEEASCLTRPYGSQALLRAQALVADWMRDAGMQVRRDSVGNLIGRYDGERDARALLLGSHLDSVRDAGAFDGPLGVLLALACVERLEARARRLPFALEVIAFADEEGLRFHTAYLGSSALAGAFDTAWLRRRDSAGVALAEAVRAMGGDPAAIAAAARRPEELLGYLEAHIEQGPLLETLGLPVGVVTGIQAQSRCELCFTGQAGHAGTLPMAHRRDALCAAAELVLAAEALARSEAGLVATVGQLTVAPGASNVVPGQVRFSLDVRHADDGILARAVAALEAEAARIAARRGVALEWVCGQVTPAVTCAPELTALLEAAIAAQGLAAPRLASGAGHDAVMLARITPVAMLFVRCAGGVSHHPAEAVALEDVAVALAVLEEVLERLAKQHAAEAGV